MSFKNKLIKRLCCRRAQMKEEREKRFLIVSTTGLGDTLWGTPAIRALREAYPKEYIAILTNPIGKELLGNNPHIHEIFVLRNPPLFSLLTLYKPLVQRGITHALLFHTSRRCILPFISKIRPRMIVGTEGMHKGLDDLLTHALPRCKEHEIDRRLRIVSAVGAHPSSNELELFISPSEESIVFPRNTPIVAIHPGANARFKCWPPSHFIALAKRLYETLGCQLYITGSSKERPLVHSLVQALSHERARPLTHLSVSAFVAFLQRIQLFITNDTGPMHCAVAVQTPTLALFASTDPALCGPRTSFPYVKVLRAERTCSLCLEKQCQDPFCFLQIGVDEAYRTATRLLSLSNEDFPIRGRADIGVVEEDCKECYEPTSNQH